MDNGTLDNDWLPGGKQPPTTFIKGVGVHMWQSSGDDGVSNWTRQLKSWWPLNWLRFAPARLQGKYMVTERCPNSWDRFEEDCKLAAAMGCSGFRLNLEWARLEPQQGIWDDVAVARYREMLSCLLAHGMEPNVTLHHFTHPAWFDDLGGWTHPANIQLFVEFAVHAVEVFGDQVKMWATFNEPTSTSSMGFIFGAYPPGVLLRPSLAGEALRNMLAAHTRTYKAIKALPGGQQHQVGITHMILKFEPWPSLGWLTAHSNWLAHWMTEWWGYDPLHEWALTGRFKWELPLGFGRALDWQEEGGKPPMDWFGVNFYARPVISPLCLPGRRPGQVLTDLGYPIDPEGLGLALERCSAYSVPLYVTETGVSIDSEEHRCYMINAYMSQVLAAMKKGMDIRGFYYWTLLDNFEWNAGYSIKFGLYAWDPTGTEGDRTPRGSSRLLAKWYARLPSKISALRQQLELQQEEEGGSIAGSSKGGVTATAAKVAPCPPLPTWSWWATELLLRYLQLVQTVMQQLGLA